jgi:hypothetical protein
VIDEGYVRRAAEEVGLTIPEADIGTVTGQLQRIAEVARSLERAELDPLTDELAPVWRP